MKQFYVLFAVLAVAVAAPSSEADGILTSALKFVRDCGEKSIVLCAKVSRPSRLVRPVLFYFTAAAIFVPSWFCSGVPVTSFTKRATDP